ncbi:uncharacterized protein LOC111074604 [Drosophila obscura]|uniref:uncharacterized protein LOC111074604 n=1 Tax=Drosophila obscura TaxID=7282 RepID=UPI000B9FBDF2|nr:uncharacterized protein LOC111074604 [Drosophila obscura]XP_022223135.1 uncharacterized protein LOC111074604 [Drosophila obscura]XP_022223136.1 uncharacterized protein LOC111074604 [Drosophila obscura]
MTLKPLDCPFESQRTSPPAMSLSAWSVVHQARPDMDREIRIGDSSTDVQAPRRIQATAQWGNTQWEVMKASKGVDFYNVLKETLGDRFQRQLAMTPEERQYRTMVKFEIDEDRDQLLEELIRGPVAETLGIPSNVKWGSESSSTFDIHRTDFMKPVIHIVNELLEKTPLKVGVFSCATTALMVHSVGTATSARRRVSRAWTGCAIYRGRTAAPAPRGLKNDNIPEVFNLRCMTEDGSENISGSIV